MGMIVLLYALLASTFVFAKFALDFASPVFLIGFRMTLAGSLLLGYLLLFKRESLKIKKEDLFIFLRVSFFHIYLAFLAELTKHDDKEVSDKNEQELLEQLEKFKGEKKIRGDILKDKRDKDNISINLVKRKIKDTNVFLA